MPVGLNEEQLQRIDEVVAVRRKIKRGGTLFRNGEAFTSLYAIRTGFFQSLRGDRRWSRPSHRIPDGR